jgi:hypothetical protein
MPSASKIKGSGFEREIAKYLSDLYGESFIRSPGSGAYTGGINSARRQVLHENQVRSFKGDIVPGESFPNFNCEAKFYADFAFHQLFVESKQLEDWIAQLMTAADSNDLNILFIKFNRRGKFVAVQEKENWNSNSANVLCYHSKNWGAWLIYSFDIFFNLNTTQLKNFSNRQILLETNHIS